MFATDLSMYVLAGVTSGRGKRVRANSTGLPAFRGDEVVVDDARDDDAELSDFSDDYAMDALGRKAGRFKGKRSE